MLTANYIHQGGGRDPSKSNRDNNRMMKQLAVVSHHVPAGLLRWLSTSARSKDGLSS